MIAAAVPNTLRLTLPAFFFSMLISVVLGVVAATRRDTLLDAFVKFIAILGQALPSFWLAIVLIFIFSVYWQLLPPAGIGPLPHYIMPVFILAFFILPGMTRLVRSTMLDVLDSEYIKLARIKGLSEAKVIWKHALRNALIAPLTTSVLIFVTLFTGSVIIENVYNWPGVGRLIIEAVVARDFPVVQGIVILVAAMFLLMNLLVDIAYGFIDPQIRYQRT
jgi:peptide/nickel transport system permease protein